MTSKKSYASLGKAVGVELRRMRSFILLWAMLYIIVGPVFQLMTVLSLRISPSVQELFVGRFFFVNSFISFYIFAVALGILGGFYATHYQNVPSQSYFYHSLPMTREGLLGSRVVALTSVQAVLLLIVVVSNTVAGAMSAAGLGITTTLLAAGALHFVYIMLVFLMSLGVTLLAGQLTANTIGHVLMTLVFNVSIPAFAGYLALIFTGNTYTQMAVTHNLVSANIARPAFDKMSELTGKLSNVNPVTYDGDIASLLSAKDLLWPMGTTVAYLVLLAAVFFLAFLLYRNRAVEKAGDTLVYAKVGSVIKGFYAALAGALGGITFDQMFGGSGIGAMLGFVCGVLIGALVVHVVAELIYAQGSATLRKNYFSILVAVVTTVALFFGVNAGLIDLDKQVPKASSVRAATVYGMDNTFTADLSLDAAKNPETIEKIMTAMTKAQEKAVVSPRDSDYYGSYTDKSLENATDEMSCEYLCFTYKTALGVSTRYFYLTSEDARDILAPLVDDTNYQQMQYSTLMNLDFKNLDECMVSSNSLYENVGSDVIYLVDNVNDNVGDVSAVANVEDGKARAKALLEAVQSDIPKRDGQTLQGKIVGYTTFSYSSLDQNGDYTYNGGMYLPIYEGDKKSAALLDAWRTEGFMPGEAETVAAACRDYDAALVRLGDNGSEKLADMSLEDFAQAVAQGDLVEANRADKNGMDVNRALGVTLTLKNATEDESYPITFYYTTSAELPAEAVTNA